MSEGRRAASEEIARRAQRRSRFQAAWAGIKTIFTFALLAGLCGFAYGMWEEVGAAPDKYAARVPDEDMGSLRHWSAKAGILIANLRGGRAERSAPHDTLARGGDPRLRLSSEPANKGLAEPTQEELDALLRELDAQAGKFDDSESLAPEPGSEEPEPKPPAPKPEPVNHVGPKPPPVAEPRGRKLPPSMDAKTAELLEKARNARKTAMQHYQGARPEAPPNGRDAATRQTLVYLKAAQKYYEAALNGKMSSDERKRASAEITSVQRHMYWCHKFLSAWRRE
ncbi:MAG: hypothetical protein ABIF82_10105 [Planctomycetota bacterium]